MVTAQGVSQAGATGSGPQEEKKKPVLDVRVSSDGLTATLSVKLTEQGQTVSYEEVLEYLRQQGITNGICESTIRDFCDHKKFFIEIICAKGKSEVDQEDGKIEYFFKKDNNLMPGKRDDGTVDYRNLGLVQNVKKGDVLCKIVQPAPGEDGVDVFGHAIAARKGKIPVFPSGKNTVISEDGSTLCAEIDGCIDFKNGMLNINDVFMVRGNVDSSSGNVDAIGSVTIQGDVLEGFFVKSGGDIVVRGMVEGARLEAQGSISISKGMNGMGKGKLIAGGNITAKYFENSSINCAGDLCADVIMNSMVTAGHNVVLRGRNGLLVGGRCCVGKQVYANVIGTDNNLKTEVQIDSPILNRLMLKSAVEKDLDNLKNQFEEATAKSAVIKSQIKTINLVISSGKSPIKAKMLLRTALAQQKEIDEQVKDLQDKINLAEQVQNESIVDFNVVGVKKIFSGTKIMIGSLASQLVNDYSSMKFYVDKGEIVSGPLIPSDRLDY